MTKILLDAKALSDVAIKGLQEIKGKSITRLDLRESDGAVTDFFVICTGTSDKHVQSLANSVMEFMKKEGERPLSKEGMENGEWVLLDYVNVVVHIFQEDFRNFYRLESLWGDAKTQSYKDVG